ncbi:MAG: DUF2752 domain-containing protein [Verrucomicrobiota bacterium]
MKRVLAKHCFPILLLAVGAPAIVLIYALDPAKTALFPPCPFKLVTGHACPGCGSLRALHALLHGNIKVAFGLNPLAVLSLPLILALIVERYRKCALTRPKFIKAYLLTILVFWLLRNIPVFPFTKLAPH